MDFKKAISDKKSELSELYERYKQDRDLLYNAYELKDAKENKIPFTLSVTLNDLLVFAVNVESALGNAVEQCVVETEDKAIDTAYIEDFITSAFKMADKRLMRMGRYSVNQFIDQQMCRRGRGIARCLFRVVNGELIADLSPWDVAYSYYSIGENGLLWAAYDGYSSQDVIKASYPDAKLDSKSTTAKLKDCWDDKHYEVYVGEEKVAEKAHPYGYTPIAVQVVPMGAMTADEDDIKRHGESIFFMIRDLVPELNRLVSIIQSLNQKSLDNAMQYFRSKENMGKKLPEYDDVTAPGSLTEAEIGGGARPVDIGEIKRSAYLLHQIIEQRIRWGTMEVTSVGDLPAGGLSAVALIEIGEGKDQVFLPRLGARGMLRQQLAEMIISQTIMTAERDGSSVVEVGTPGHTRGFDIAKLKGEYEISYKYFIKSPKIDIARYSMAAAAGDLIPDKYKRRDIIQLQDPEEAERWLRWEEAERISPIVKMNRTIRALIEMAKRGDKEAELEAEMLSAEMGVTLDSILKGDSSMIPKPEKPQQPQPMVPMFGKGGGGQPSSQQRSAQLTAEPRQEE